MRLFELHGRNPQDLFAYEELNPLSSYHQLSHGAVGDNLNGLHGLMRRSMLGCCGQQSYVIGAISLPEKSVEPPVHGRRAHEALLGADDNEELLAGRDASYLASQVD